MGMEPAFSRATVSWPLAGIGTMPPEPDDPAFAIPHGALQPGLRDAGERIYIADTKAELSAKPPEPLHAAQGRSFESSGKWKIAIACSLLLHAAVAWAFLSGFVDEHILIEGSDQAGVLLLGNAPEDQASSGAPANEPDTMQVTLVPMVQPKPVESIEALPVEAAETVQPVDDAATEAPVAETLSPVAETPAEPVPTETMTAMPVEPEPEVLSAETVSPAGDNIVQPPVPEQPAKADEIPAAKPAPASETVAPEPEPKPVERPKPVEKKAEPKEPPKKGEKAKPGKTAEKPREKAEKPKAAEKKAEAGKARSGSNGQNQADSKRGVADGKASGKNTAAGRSGRSSAAGNAAVSNYPGKVAAKLRRAMRSLSRSTISKARRDVRVSFTVSASGGLNGVSIASSSGSPDLDQAALAIVRRAAPFPPIPADAGRSSWSFTLPLGVK